MIGAKPIQTNNTNDTIAIQSLYLASSCQITFEMRYRTWMIERLTSVFSCFFLLAVIRHLVVCDSVIMLFLRLAFPCQLGSTRSLTTEKLFVYFFEFFLILNPIAHQIGKRTRLWPPLIETIPMSHSVHHKSEK